MISSGVKPEGVSQTTYWTAATMPGANLTIRRKKMMLSIMTGALILGATVNTLIKIHNVSKDTTTESEEEYR